MAHKNKQMTFKNPFDLIQQEQQPMSMPSTRQVYSPKTQNVHSPLPFNPYEISKDPSPPKENKPQVKQPLYQPSQNTKDNSDSFASPFPEQEKESNAASYPQNQYQSQPRPQKQYELDQNGDPPLLEDIGIEPDKIKGRVLLVLKFKAPDYDTIQDPDLSGPILIALALGMLLLMTGKIHFGDIYAMFIFGNILIYFLLNFISQVQMVSLYSIMSIMGYGLLPLLPLGAVGIFVSLKGPIGIVVALATAAWSSFAAGNFMDVLIKDTKDRKALVIYPLFLFYVSFTMIVIF